MAFESLVCHPSCSAPLSKALLMSDTLHILALASFRCLPMSRPASRSSTGVASAEYMKRKLGPVAPALGYHLQYQTQQWHLCTIFFHPFSWLMLPLQPLSHTTGTLAMSPVSTQMARRHEESLASMVNGDYVLPHRCSRTLILTSS